jgi:mannose-6-phosphate isomerase
MSVPGASFFEGLTRHPLALAPNRVYRLWRGGALLDRLQGRPRPEDAHYPEEWVGSTTITRLPGRSPNEKLSHVMLPNRPPVSLKSLIDAFPKTMLGATHITQHGSELTVLCKILDTAMRLPIQYHPDQTFAQHHLDSNFGKTKS